MDVQVSYPLAFLAGLVSFLSPCILPVVPSYLAFVSGLTLEEMTGEAPARARVGAALHSTLFVIGFSLVFLTMGLVATSAGPLITQSLPWIHRIGGVLVVLFGLFLLGVLRLPVLERDLRVEVERRPVGAVGALLVGVAFGAGWTPCIGPVLGSILLYASLETTMLQGAALLSTYALGLGIPFVLASVALNAFFIGSRAIRRWILPLQRAAGTLLVVMGILMVTGHFARVTASLAAMGQLINLDLP